MVDHSMQFGNEKLMVVLGVDADKFPEQGQALRRQVMVVLEIRVASNWKTEDMDREYSNLLPAKTENPYQAPRNQDGG